MLTATLRPLRARRLLGLMLLAGLAGALAVASVGLLRGARSVHVRPADDVIGAEAAGSGIPTDFAALHSRLDGSGQP
ncbi:MAG: hypothetical protein KJO11_16645 [Gemmatimonadetes bacterium]|nr:hypothetical protein [Gemmatimonadota bacterium]MBT8404920.1 hypothetical protein [Gemmatimonadota bacterium]NNF37943.1 hypothetical protein [Gemmatimonadota bacterium]NNK64854.1 hypothetical protein [Gemmatimonadota bacterium]